jgi:hypothetical protein
VLFVGEIVDADARTRPCNVEPDPFAIMTPAVRKTDHTRCDLVCDFEFDMN